ncbi:cytochrome P450 [Nakamurella alba]|nr:cytochrome P450 [Nakamurella alba]
MTTSTLPPTDLLAPGPTADPYDIYANLRRDDPVHWNPFQKAWLITRYQDVCEAYLDPRLSSDRIRPMLGMVAGDRQDEMGRMLAIMAEWMVVTDGPAHHRLRKLANTAFRQQRVAAMGEWIGEIVDGLVDRFVASGSEDFYQDIAFPMPATVIATMMGAPAEDALRFQKWSDELALVAFGTGGAERADRYRRALAGITEMQSYLSDLIDKARSAPGSDMIGVLLTSQDAEGDRLDDDELIALCSLILFAGHETTTNLLCNGVVSLLQHPEQLEKLRADRGLVPTAVEEMLRFDGPIKTIQRWVVEDHERDGRQLKAGQRVFLMNSAANRDGGTFDRPDDFDITRPTQPLHVAFGRGVHSCLGAQLARLETRTAIPIILDRLPGLRLAGPVSYRSTTASRAVTSLLVQHDAGVR